MARAWPALALLGCLAQGCDLPGKPKQSDRYIPPQDEISFNTLFQQNCAGCHGTEGKLGPAPALNDKLFLALVPDAELQTVISKGRPGTLMPPFANSDGGGLTAEQVRILAEGIKAHWGGVESDSAGAPPYLLQPTKAGAAQSKEGAQVFARACASCHGDHGKGGETVGAINDPDFLALISDQALRRIVITGRPELGMPGYADPKGRQEDFKPLTSEEVTDLVALLASWRQGEAIATKGN
jgi:mono/diheme cytochrome c family protein